MNYHLSVSVGGSSFLPEEIDKAIDKALEKLKDKYAMPMRLLNVCITQTGIRANYLIVTIIAEGIQSSCKQ